MSLPSSFSEIIFGSTWEPARTNKWANYQRGVKAGNMARFTWIISVGFASQKKSNLPPIIRPFSLWDGSFWGCQTGKVQNSESWETTSVTFYSNQIPIAIPHRHEMATQLSAPYFFLTEWSSGTKSDHSGLASNVQQVGRRAILDVKSYKMWLK
jgi:hypothetical protein